MLQTFTAPELISMLTEARTYWCEARADGNHPRRVTWARAIDNLLDELNDRP